MIALDTLYSTKERCVVSIDEMAKTERATRPIFHKREVRTYLVDAFCGECMAELVSTGRAHLMSPPKYVYRCPTCKRESVLTKNYPSTEYE